MSGAASPINPLKTLSGTKDPAGLIEERANNQTTYPLADAHGDITAVTSQSGQITARHNYDPWREEIQPSGPGRQMGYLGAYLRRSDPDTGLVQMGARQYDPGLGRFASEDPVLGRTYMGQSLNRHSYVINNPLLYLDLDGRSIFEGDFWKEWVDPALNTVGNMGRPWKWDELAEDVKGGHEIIRSYLAKKCNAANLAVGAVSLFGAGKFLKAIRLAHRYRKTNPAVGNFGSAGENLAKIEDALIKGSIGGLLGYLGAKNLSRCFT